MEQVFWKGRGFIGVFVVFICFLFSFFFYFFLCFSFFFLFLFFLVSFPFLGFYRAAASAKIATRLLDY